MTATGRAAGARAARATARRAGLAALRHAVRGASASSRTSVRALGVLMETEVWPNLLAAARGHGVPVVLANARLSERSARGYARVAGADARRVRAPRRRRRADRATTPRGCARSARATSRVTGNLKFDIGGRRPTSRHAASALRAPLGDAPGAASRRRRATARRRCCSTRSRAKPLPPRHADWSSCRAIRSASTRSPSCCARAACRFARRSDDAPVPGRRRVLLGDSMGEMLAYYAAADVAFVGGSLLPLGGQNLIEPIALGRADDRRAAHVQLRRGRATQAIDGRRRAARRRRRRARSTRPARCCATRGARCAHARALDAHRRCSGATRGVAPRLARRGRAAAHCAAYAVSAAQPPVDRPRGPPRSARRRRP